MQKQQLKLLAVQLGGGCSESEQSEVGKDDTSWALSNDATTGSFTVELGQKRRFDIVELKEDIAKGQRISGFKIEVTQRPLIATSILKPEIR